MNLQNKGINSELDAWLAFLSVDDPETIEQLIQIYPQFKPMYQQIYYICRNTERVMELYSEELKILDRNTVQLMIDEMQEELVLKDRQLSQRDLQLSQKDRQLSQKDLQLTQSKQQLGLLSKQSEQQLLEIAHLKKLLAANGGQPNLSPHK